MVSLVADKIKWRERAMCLKDRIIRRRENEEDQEKKRRIVIQGETNMVIQW